MDGIIRTRVGYAGGTTPDPEYYNLGDHTECLQIDYDAKVISFSTILDLFWDDHNPWIRSWSTQYQSALYAHDDQQLKAALDRKASLSESQPREVHTVVEPLNQFYIAEDYHQKYYLQQSPVLMRAFETCFRYFSDFNDSPSVAKVNGFASGKGSRDDLQKVLPKLALPPQAEKYLLDRSKK